MRESVFLHGVALANYRGIGDEVAFIGPFRRFNFMIGANNSGKSCVLTFIANHLKPWVCEEQNRFSRGERKELDPLDIHLGASRPQVKMGIGIPAELVRKNFSTENPKLVGHGNLPKFAELIVQTVAHNDVIWLSRTGADGQLALMIEPSIESLKSIGEPHLWDRLWRVLLNASGGQLEQHWIPDTIRLLISSVSVALPPICLIPAIRQISPKGQEFSGWAGAGLIEELARLQNPKVHERERLEKFHKINGFLQAVTEHASARIEIPHDRECVLVHMDGKVLPLESLGTGIHEVCQSASNSFQVSASKSFQLLRLI